MPAPHMHICMHGGNAREAHLQLIVESCSLRNKLLAWSYNRSLPLSPISPDILCMRRNMSRARHYACTLPSSPRAWCKSETSPRRHLYTCASRAVLCQAQAREAVTGLAKASSTPRAADSSSSCQMHQHLISRKAIHVLRWDDLMSSAA